MLTLASKTWLKENVLNTESEHVTPQMQNDFHESLNVALHQTM